LSSDILGLGNTLNKYKDANKQSVVVDYNLKGLPETIKEEDLKKIAGVKHVISATVEHDNIKNVCTGTGNIKMRLDAESENPDIVKL